MTERHLIVIRVGDGYFRDADKPRPFAENIARWDVLDVALRAGRLVALQPLAVDAYRAHAAEPIAARWVAQRSPGDEIPGAGRVERLPTILLRALGPNVPAGDPDRLAAHWGRDHGFAADGEGRIRAVRGDGSLSPQVAASWTDFAARLMPDGMLLLVDGQHRLAEEGSVPGR